MEIQPYLDNKIDLHGLLLEFIEKSHMGNDDFTEFINIFRKYVFQNGSKKSELDRLCRILDNIVDGHHGHSLFYPEIEKIILILEEDIKSTFDDEELYEIFQYNKMILLILITHGILNVDISIFHSISDKGYSFQYFFYPELKKFYSDDQIFEASSFFETNDSSIPSDFFEKRDKCENDSYICSLIRDDRIDEFRYHMHRMNISAKSCVEPSIYETHTLLFEDVKLIEYAAYFGSMKIFLYLLSEGAQMSPKLWMFAIHGGNPKMIHFLEDHKNFNHSMDEETCRTALKTAIQFHFNSIADYICNHFAYKGIEEDICTFCIQYYNFTNNFVYLITPERASKYLHEAVRYDYVDFVKILIENTDVDINQTISNHFLFFITILRKT